MQLQENDQLRSVRLGLNGQKLPTGVGCTHLVGLPGTINANHLIQLVTHPEMGLCVCLACHTGPSEC